MIMTEEQARMIIGNLDEYVDQFKGGSYCLDGNFTIEQLKALVYCAENGIDIKEIK